MTALLLMAVGVGTLSAGWTSWALATRFLERFPVGSIDPRAIPFPEKFPSPIPLFFASLLLLLLGLVFFPAWVAILPLALGLKPAIGILSGFRKKWGSQKKEAALRDLFPQALGMAVQALKIGQTLPQALSYMSQECPSPLREEFSLAVSEMGLGASTEDAIAHLTERTPRVLEFGQFLEAIRISRTTGANLAQLLQALLEGMEEKNRILRKMDAMTAQARLSGLLMGSLPILLAGVFFWMDPTLIRPLFTERIGWAILLLATFLETMGFLWIRQLLRVEV